MPMKIVWLPKGEDIEYCPYCHSHSIWPTEVHGLWYCQNCNKDFSVSHFKPKPAPQKKGMSPEEFNRLYYLTKF